MAKSRRRIHMETYHLRAVYLGCLCCSIEVVEFMGMIILYRLQRGGEHKVSCKPCPSSWHGRLLKHQLSITAWPSPSDIRFYHSHSFRSTNIYAMSIVMEHTTWWLRLVAVFPSSRLRRFLIKAHATSPSFLAHFPGDFYFAISH